VLFDLLFIYKHATSCCSSAGIIEEYRKYVFGYSAVTKYPYSDYIVLRTFREGFNKLIFVFVVFVGLYLYGIIKNVTVGKKMQPA